MRLRIALKYFVVASLLLLLACCKNNSGDKDSQVTIAAISEVDGSGKPRFDENLQATTDTAVSINLESNSNESNSYEECLKKFSSPYSFDTFKAEVFTGKMADPDFTGSKLVDDKEYVSFIRDGCSQNGINFGGRYTIIHKGCGAMCEHLFIVDRITGKICTDIGLSEGHYGYLYHKDSYLLIANSNLFQDDTLGYYCNHFETPRLYRWRDNSFQLLYVGK